MKILVAYDGTRQSKEALMYGMKKVREQGGEVIAMNVFNRPLFTDYDAIPDAMSLARTEAACHVAEAKALLAGEGKGIRASLVTTEGDPEESTLSYARELGVDLLLCPPRYRSVRRAVSRTGARENEAFLHCPLGVFSR